MKTDSHDTAPQINLQAAGPYTATAVLCVSGCPSPHAAQVVGAGADQLTPGALPLTRLEAITLAEGMNIAHREGIRAAQAFIPALVRLVRDFAEMGANPDRGLTVGCYCMDSGGSAALICVWCRAAALVKAADEAGIA